LHIIRSNNTLTYKYQTINGKLNPGCEVGIGYGGKDQEINKMILEHFDFENKPIYIIDPFPSAEIKFLMGKLGASMIEKSLQEVEMEDII
jgi:hypothetical protein